MTPLYNLSFHTILPSTVSDAGTDQKVAKFSRKGVDVDGFGVLEPHELVPGLNDLATLEARSGTGTPFLPSAGGVGSSSPTQHDSRDGSMVSPKLPGSDPGVEPPADTSVEPPTSFEAMTPEARENEKGMGARFMRRFKGLSVGSAKSVGGGGGAGGGEAGPAPSIAGGVSTSSGLSGFFGGLGSSVKSGRTATFDSRRPASVAAPHGTAGGIVPAVRSSGSIAAGSVGPGVVAASASAPLATDVAPLVAGAGLLDGSRKTRGYYWTIKKLTRRVTDDYGNLPEIPFGPDGQIPVLRNVWKRFNAVNRMGGDEGHPHPADIPVRFEWTKESRGGGSETRSSSGGGGGAAARRNGAARSSLHQRAATDAMSARKRMSVASTGTGTTARSSLDDVRGGGALSGSLRPPTAGAREMSPSPRVSTDDGGHNGEYDGGGGDNTGYDSDPEDSETPWSCHLVLGGDTKIPIGTLSPAPHHPKVVAQLAVPFPLPDLSQTGLGGDRAGLTREEIKDIICVTCLHLVIRESFGGLGGGGGGGGGGSGSKRDSTRR